MAHAILSPSSAKRWSSCVASPLEERGCPDQTTGFAAAGTRAHRIAEITVREVFMKAELTAEERSEREQLLRDAAAEADDVQSHLAQYFDTIQGITTEMEGAESTDMHVELPLDISELTTEQGAHGTADFVAVADNDLWIGDLKYGAGVPVEAEKNIQLAIYAHAAMSIYEALEFSIKRVHLIIVQPRCGGVRRWDTTAEMIRGFGNALRTRAQLAMSLYTGAVKPDESSYMPSTDVCRFCKAKMKCKAYTAKVKEGLLGDYQVIDAPTDVLPEPVKAELTAIPVPTTAAQLAKAHEYLPIIEQWCKEVSSAVVARLQSGESLPGLKLVEGRKGPRKWDDAKAVEEMLQSMRLKREQMYDFKLISPTTMEKLVKQGVIGARQAKRLRELITQSSGSPVVASSDDPRPAIAVGVRSDFEALPE